MIDANKKGAAIVNGHPPHCLRHDYILRIALSNLTRTITTARSQTAPDKSEALPERTLATAYVTIPIVIPCAMEKVSGVSNSTTPTGAASVRSSQFTSFRVNSIRMDT